MSELGTKSVKRNNLSFVSTSGKRFVRTIYPRNVPFKEKTSTKKYVHTDSIRFRQWVHMCNDPRLDALEPILVQKRYRICRRHFDSDCMNGGCRRLLNTAIPTLHMNGSPGKNLNLIVEETNDLESKYILAVKDDLTLVSVGIEETKDDQEKHFEIIPTSKPTPMSVPTVESMYIALNCNQCIHRYFFNLFIHFLFSVQFLKHVHRLRENQTEGMMSPVKTNMDI